ncbi:hypothetical protein INR49_011788, partial [Caranx melampygus]
QDSVWRELEVSASKQKKKKNDFFHLSSPLDFLFSPWNDGQHWLSETVICSVYALFSSAAAAAAAGAGAVACRCSARLDTVEDAGDIQHAGIYDKWRECAYCHFSQDGESPLPFGAAI